MAEDPKPEPPKEWQPLTPEEKEAQNKDFQDRENSEKHKPDGM